MTRIFGGTSKAIGQTTRFLKRCRFSLDEIKRCHEELGMVGIGELIQGVNNALDGC